MAQVGVPGPDVVAARERLRVGERARRSQAEPAKQRFDLGLPEPARAQAARVVVSRANRQSSATSRPWMQTVVNIDVVGSRTAASRGSAASRATSSALT
jgi:hypothetical protein